MAKGRLDLSAWDFAGDGNVSLNGNWEFYWDRLLDPADFPAPDTPAPGLTGYYPVPLYWTQYADLDLPPRGFATYRVVVQTAGDAETLSIKTPELYTEYSLWINGQLIDRHGSFAAAPPRYLHPRVYTFDASGDTLELVLQIANQAHRNAGIGQSFQIGTPDNIYSMRVNAVARDLVIFAVCFFVGCYHLILFFYQRRSIELAFFAVFCFAVSLRGLISNETFLLQLVGELPFSYGSRFLTALIPLITISVLYYTAHLYPKEMPRRLLQLLTYLNLLYLLLVTVTPTYFYASLFNYYLITVAAACFLGVYTPFRSFMKGNREAAIFFVGAIFIVIGAFNDMLFYNQLIDSGYHLSLGLAVFTLAQSGLLAIRFNRAFHEKEELAAKLQAKDRARDELLAFTAHELRTPINSIVLMAEGLFAKGQEGISTTHKQMLESIASGGRRLAGLVNDILDFAAVKERRLKLAADNFNLYRLLRLVVSELKPLASAKDLQLTFPAEEEELNIIGDRYRLSQVLHNLLHNAIKFTPAGGTVAITAGRLEERVFVSVKDTGIGIPREQIPFIFRRYEQLDEQITRHYGGMGLGLTIAMELAEAHGGTIAVESEPGRGSTFTLELPYRPGLAGEEAPKLTAPQLPQAMGGPASALFVQGVRAETIIIIDDNYPAVLGVSEILKPRGYTIKGFVEPRQGLAALLQDSTAVLGVVDLMMPELTGDEICISVRQRFSLLELPLLILSARTQTESIVRALQAGANDFLHKPFEPEELAARVQTLVNLKASADRAVASELAFMQAQIKPHFIYNALSAISNLTTRQPQQARELLLDLADYLRGCFSLDHAGGMITLEKEMEMVRAYLSIEQARYRERLQVEYEMDASPLTLIPMLTIQPLVENAVRHGLMPKLEGGRVQIIIRQQHDGLLIQVVDNGVGMDETTLSGLLRESPPGREGVGLRNVHKRLLRHYGRGLKISSAPGAGTTVEILMERKEIHHETAPSGR